MILLATLLCNYGRGFCLIDIGTEGLAFNPALRASILEERPTLFNVLAANAQNPSSLHLIKAGRSQSGVVASGP
jgi:hypothetical protein